jgi:hypothetical protein
MAFVPEGQADSSQARSAWGGFQPVFCGRILANVKACPQQEIHCRAEIDNRRFADPFADNKEKNEISF